MNQRIAKKAVAKCYRGLSKSQQRNATLAVIRLCRRLRRNGEYKTAEKYMAELKAKGLLPPVEMNDSVGSSYPMFAIGRLLFSDHATKFPCVLMDDGYSTPENHAQMLKALRHSFSHRKITLQSGWEPMPWLDHTGRKHHFMNIKTEPKTRYCFTPNDFAKSMFGLTKIQYVGDGMTGVLEHALGKANYDRYMVAQDPLCGGHTSGTIQIILDRGKMRFEDIGTISRHDN